MKLDANKLLAEAEAHDARMKSTWWARSDGERDDSWTEPITDAAPPSEEAPRPIRNSRDASLEDAAPTSTPKFDELTRSIEQLRDAMNQRPMGSEDMPAWLLTAAGNPHTYDAPDPSRVNVCGRILPSTYERLKAAQKRMRLRTIAGTWEFLLRLGLAATERMKM